MAGRNNTHFGTTAPVLVQRGPDMGNVPQTDSYLRTKQNFDSIYESLDNIVRVIAPTTVSQEQLDVIQKALQANGENPLNLTGLIPLNNLRSVQFIGTHAQRINKQASTYPIGTLWFETDRTTLYTVLSISGAQRWVWEAGIYSSAFANRPTDLGTFDAGFLFYATDIFLTYRWSGSGWVLKGEVGVMFSGSHAARAGFTPANYPIGATYFEDNRTVIYRNNGTAWVYIGGEYRALFASRPADLVTTDAGFAFYATDTFNSYYWDGSSWVLVPRVNSLNTLTGALTLVAGNNVTVTPDANNGTITIAANANGGGGVTTLNTLVGNVNIVAGANIGVSVGNNNIMISASGGGNGVAGVATLNTLTGNLNIVAGNNATVLVGNNNITVDSIFPQDSWNNFSPSVTCSGGVVSTGVGEYGWVTMPNKTVNVRYFWQGTISANSMSLGFSLPTPARNLTQYQTVAISYISGVTGRAVAAVTAQVDDSSNSIIVRAVADFPANSNFVIIMEGPYEVA